MKRFIWDDSFALGITRLDEQHKGWVERLNDLAAAIESNQGPRQISDTLNFMVRYSEFHFAAEEELMAAHNYPDIEKHVLEHKRFRGVLANLMMLQIGQADALQKLSDSVNNFQIAWFGGHIKMVDRKFAEFLDTHAVADIQESI